MKMYNYLVSIVFMVTLASAQVNTYSPYSYFGIGNLVYSNSIINNSMAGLGSTLTNSYLLNNLNPASYSYLKMTSFELGTSSQFTKMTQNNITQNNFTASLSNIGLGFPITDETNKIKKASMAMCISPYSSLGYHINSNSNQLLIGDVNYIYSGSGGINNVLLGFSFEAAKGFSIGFNMNYLFGSLDRELVIYSEESNVKYRDINSKIISDFRPEIGLLYSDTINNYKVNFGAVIKPESQMNGRGTTFQHTFIQQGSFEYFSDTISNTIIDNSYFNFPFEILTGLGVELNTKLFVGLDYNYTKWSNYNYNGVNNYLVNNNRLIIGGNYVPNSSDIHSYFNRINYKLGASYSSGYLDLNQLIASEQILSPKPLEDFAICFGLGLPINKSFSMIHFSIEYGSRGVDEMGLFKENYCNLYISLTLNEKWFNKRKIQ